MGDVEDMIGSLEDDEEEPEEASEETEAEDEEETAFGLDLDAAWSSPDRDD